MIVQRHFLVLFSLMAVSAASTTSESQFAINGSHTDSYGVTLQTVGGRTLRVEMCDDRVVHVVASHTGEIPSPKIPIVIKACRASNVHVDVGKTEARVSTSAITVTVDAATGAVSFSSGEGKILLTEPKQGGKSFDVPSVFETKTWQVQQTFLSPSDEALYGLGQHQEGIFNLRAVPIRLSQANTNISIPFLLSSKGYGVLWNNASLTDFNPADQSIAIDPNTGKGKFTTGAKGIYGFVLTSDNRNQLMLEVNEQHVIDLQNIWTPTSASGAVELEGNKEYDISARGGPGGVRDTSHRHPLGGRAASRRHRSAARAAAGHLPAR